MAVKFNTPTLPPPSPAPKPDPSRVKATTTLVARSGLPFYAADNLLHAEDQKYRAKTMTDFLFTADQKRWMKEEQMTAMDVLTGNFSTAEAKTIEGFMKEWNKRLGTDLFHF